MRRGNKMAETGTGAGTDSREQPAAAEHWAPETQTATRSSSAHCVCITLGCAVPGPNEDWKKNVTSSMGFQKENGI